MFVYILLLTWAFFSEVNYNGGLLVDTFGFILRALFSVAVITSRSEALTFWRCVITV